MESQSILNINTNVAILRDGKYLPFNVGDQLKDGDALINNTDGPLTISSLLNPAGDNFQVVSLEPGGSAQVAHRGEDHVDLLPLDGATLALTDEIEADAAEVVIHDESTMMGLVGGGVGLASGLLAAGGLAALAALGAGSDDDTPTTVVDATPEEEPPAPTVAVEQPPTDPTPQDPPVTVSSTQDLTGVAGLLADTGDALGGPLADAPLIGQLIGGVDGLAGALAGAGDQLSDATGDIPVLGDLLGTVGGLVGSVTEVPTDSVNSTGLTALLEDTGNTLNTGFADTPLLGELTDVLGDVVGAGTGELLPTPAGLADVTDTLGGALSSAPADVPLVSDLTSLLGGVVGQLGDASTGANSPTFDSFPDLLNFDGAGGIPDLTSLLNLG